MIFWTDTTDKKIYKTSIDATIKNEMTAVISEDHLSSTGIAVDWIYNHLYWTDEGKKTIEISNLEGNMRKILIQDGLQKPRGIAVNPIIGWMFWTDWGTEPKIERAGMDGTHREIIVSSNIGWPNGLTLDLVRKRIYWVDGKLKLISSCNYDGSQRNIILDSVKILKLPFSIATFEDWIYWTDWDQTAVFKANKFNGKNVQVFTTTETTLLACDQTNNLGIQVYHPYRQPDGVNHCGETNGNCSHLCLPAPHIGLQTSRVSCACPQKFQLMPNGYTCKEDDSNNQNVTCKADQFQCTNNECIDAKLFCSGTADCTDGSDEVDCAIYLKECNRETEFDCGKGICIPLSQVCDENPNCPDHSDEYFDQCNLNECARNNGNCSQTCVATSTGHYCDCKFGYYLVDNKTCEDINECEDPGSCSQICINKKGNFQCQCYDGYITDPYDVTRCKAIDRNVSLLITTKFGIQKISLDNSETTIIVNSYTKSAPVALDFMFRTGIFFWSDIGEEKIYKTQIQEGYNRTVSILNKIRCESLAVDWIYNHLYWINLINKTIELTNFEGNMNKILFRNDLSVPKGIAVNPNDGWMFWTNWGERSKLERAGMDGTHREIIISSEIVWPNGLTLDLVRKRIYWVDSKLKTISSCNYDGSSRKVILQSNDMLMHPLSITTFEDSIYWSDLQKYGIYKADKFFGTDVAPIQIMSDSPMTLHIYHPYRQPEGINLCGKTNGNCSHICLPTPFNTSQTSLISCACPENHKLMSNGLTCIKYDECSSKEFKCKAGGCIPLNWQCDREKDCIDGSDEDPLICKNKPCTVEEFNCRSIPSECVPLTWRCDGVVDCADGFDEKLCNETCRPDQFTCANQHCINIKWRCDGDRDCGDGSDEVGCASSVTPTPSICMANEFQCSDKLSCIHKSFLCDGDGDCPDNGDEDIAHCPNITCRADQFQCKDKTCIPGQLYCSGKAECADGSDEVNCTAPTKACDKKTEFDCGGGICIPLAKVCDKKPDCPNFLDEPSDKCGHNGCEVNNGDCSQICVDTPAGFYCDCKPGYKLMDNKTCEDVDECADPGSCSHICINEKGTFKCQCHSGYMGDSSDFTRCKATEGHASLLLATRYEIRKISLDHHEMTAIVNNTKSATALDFVFRTGMIFWSDVNEQKIYKAPIDEGSERTVVISKELITSDGLAVDWIYNHLYWTDTGKNTIELSNLEGNMRKILIRDNLGKPRAIALNPIDGWMFWTDWGVNPKIERAGMDGTHRETIVSVEITWPNGLTLDLVRKRVYWVDAKLNVISSCNYDGSERRVILYSVEYLKRPFSITTFEDWVYWTDWNKGAVYKANKFTGKDVEAVTTVQMHIPRVINVYHPYRQPDGVNHCAAVNGNCSHLCLPAPRIGPQSPLVSCACPQGLRLMPNSLMCVEDVE